MRSTRPRRTPLTVALDSEWESRYADTTIDLGHLGTATGAEWLARLRSTPEGQDQILRELLHDASRGGAAAQRTVLKMMMPKIIACSRTQVREPSPHDRVAIAVTIAWETIRTFRVTERMTRIRGCLVMSIVHAIGHDAAPSGELPVDPATLSRLPVEATVERRDRTDWVRTMLRSATVAGVVRAEDVDVLIRVELGAERRRAIAAEKGVSYRALNRQLSRTKARLATHFAAADTQRAAVRTVPSSARSGRTARLRASVRDRESSITFRENLANPGPLVRTLEASTSTSSSPERVPRTGPCPPGQAALPRLADPSRGGVCG